MTDTTENLALPLLVQGQAQKEVWHNEALSMLDALVQCMVKDKDLAAPPASPAEGERWIVAAGATGVWTGRATQIAAWRDDAWSFFAPRDGHIAFVDDESRFYVFNGGTWSDLFALITALQNLSLLGVGTTADATNKLAVSSAAVLFNHAGAGIQAKLNKAAAASTASFLFQTAFSGRAEFGLIGSDNFGLKVSANGSAFQDVFTVDRTTGQATFTTGTVQIQVDVVTASGTWTKPGWAKRVIAFATGAGGGGGSGRRGAAASDRRGGGGGGAGGQNRAEWLAAEIGASLSVTIGAGGTAAAAATVNDTNGAVGGAGGGGGYGDGGAGNAGGAGGSTTGGTGIYLTLGAGPGGGAGGGGISTADAVGAGGTGAYGHFSGGSGRRATTAAGGAAGLGGNGGAAKAWQRGAGGGGGGGGAGNAAGTASGGAGGLGGLPGGGAGGGGAATNGANSGAGGIGGRGEVWFMSIG